jgi:hypothetical protein
MNARALGALLGGLLAPAALLLAFRVQPFGWYAMAGNTLEGVPFDTALLVASVATGALLGGTCAPRIVRTNHPLRWMALLASAAGPVGAVGVSTLVLLGGGDPGRGLLTFGLLLGYSPLFALPLAAPVAVAGVVGLRLLAARPAWLGGGVLGLMAIPVVIALSASLSAGAQGNNRTPTPLDYLPPVSRERAIAAATPIAADLSRAGAVLLSATPYALGDIVAGSGCDGSMPPVIEGGCGSSAPAWAVFYTVTMPDGVPDTIMVVIDGTTGELLLSGSPLIDPHTRAAASLPAGRP